MATGVRSTQYGRRYTTNASVSRGPTKCRGYERANWDDQASRTPSPRALFGHTFWLLTRGRQWCDGCAIAVEPRRGPAEQDLHPPCANASDSIPGSLSWPITTEDGKVVGPNRPITLTPKPCTILASPIGLSWASGARHRRLNVPMFPTVST